MAKACGRNEGELDLRRSVAIPPLSGECTDVAAHREAGPEIIVGLLGYLINSFAVVVNALRPCDLCVLFYVGCIAARQVC